jgi:hypothetical protein
MEYYLPAKNRRFTGRESYWQRLKEIDAQDEAAIVVVYGRRRVGKTELIEQFFQGRPVLKFEGLQPDSGSVRRGDAQEKQRQIDECVNRLSRYLGRPEYRNLRIGRWGDFFELLVPVLEKEPVILYLEELQWMANYGSELLSEFKPWWDDVLRHNRRLRVVISGSSPSFIVSQFLASSAMYNRSNHMMKLRPFTLDEIDGFLRKGEQETLLAAIAVGGIPEYLKQIAGAPSVFIGLCQKSFGPEAFFRVEKDRVFVSSLSGNRFYEGIIDYLARHKSATRNTLHKALTRGQSAAPGGSFSAVLQELVDLDFVERHVPVTLAPKGADPARSRQARYAIADEYLHFYYCFIEKRKADIDKGKYASNPVAAVNRQDFSKLMGHSFERWCRRNEHLIARHLGFGGVVDYSYGPWYEKDSAQIDLMFIRKDSKLIVCEVKYNNESPLTRQVIREVQGKVDAFLASHPKYARYTVETALITTEPVPQSLQQEAYFTYLVTGADLLAAARALI